MAYLESEMTNARLFWDTISDRVLVVGVVVLSYLIASHLIAALGAWAPPLMPVP